MRTPLPINLDTLLRQRAIEGERVEYEAGWNPESAVHTICAFANDFPSASVEDLSRNLIGEFLKELDLTEGRSTGVPKILRAMRNNGSPPPEFDTDEDRSFFLVRLPVHERAERGTPQVTGQVTGQVVLEPDEPLGKVLLALTGQRSRQELQEAHRLAHRDHFNRAYLQPALDAGIIEMTIPDKPRSSRQRYRLTDLGKRLQAELLARRPGTKETDPE